MHRKLRMPLTVLATSIALGSFACQNTDDADSSDADSDGSGGKETDGSGGSKPSGSGGGGPSSGGSAQGGEGGEPGDGGESGGNDDPLYALAIELTSASSDGIARLNYLVTTTSLDEGTVLSPREGIERADQLAYGFPRHPAIWMGDGEPSTPVIQRWDLVGDTFVPPTLDRTLSFANLGTGDVNLFTGTLVSLELGLVPTVSGSELHRYNPTTMELAGSLAFEPGQYVARVVTRPDKTNLVSGQRYGWNEELATFDWETNLGFSVYVLNAEGTEILGEDTWETERSAYATHGVAADGAVYFGLYANTDDEDYCILRVQGGESEFDRDFGCMPLFDLVEGAEEAGLETWPDAFLVHEDRALFVLMGPDEEGQEARPGVYAWDLKSETAERISPDEIKPWGVFIVVDGRVFVLADDSTKAMSDCVSGEGDEVVDEECVEDAEALGTPFYEIIGDDVIPAFTVAAAARTWNIVRVR